MFHSPWLPITLVALAALLSALAGLRLHHLNRHVQEPRLKRLSAFFLLFAGAQALLVTESLLLEATPARARVDLLGPIILFWLRHALLLAALAAAALAIGAPRTGRAEKAGAPAVIAFTQLAHPFLMLLQGLLLFYLVVRSALNHARRAEPGSLRVALGFLLLLAAHLLPYATIPEGPPPLGAPDATSAAVLFFGAFVLASIVHQRGTPDPAPRQRRDRSG